jgi:hypothetical protein
MWLDLMDRFASYVRARFTRPSRPVRRAARVRLGVERLGDRIVPAVYNVTNTDNAGLG